MCQPAKICSRINTKEKLKKDKKKKKVTSCPDMG
jgi:hypothetical protein